MNADERRFYTTFRVLKLRLLESSVTLLVNF